MYFLSLPLYFSLLQCVLVTFGAPAPAPGQYTLEGTYIVDFTTDEDGGCKSYEEVIRTAWSEVPGLLQAGLTAMEDLKQPMGEDKSEWRRKADTFFELFGREIPAKGWTTTGKEKDEPNYFPTQVWGTFSTYLRDHRNPVGVTTPKYHLKCTDNWLEYLGPDDTDPTDSTRTIKDNPEALAVAKGRQGIYFAKSKPDDNRWFYPSAATGGDPHPLCGVNNDISACTVVGEETESPHTRILTFCPLQLNKKDYRVTGPDVTIKRKDPFYLHGQATAIIWVHEMGHYIRPWLDPKVSVNKFKKLSLGPKKMETVYGWRNSVLLAKQNPSIAIEAPENYAVFSAAMFWSNWWWVTGKAQTPRDITRLWSFLKRPSTG